MAPSTDHDKMSDFRRICRSNLPVFSTISITAVFLLTVFADGFINNLSLHSVANRTKGNKQHQLRSTSAQKQLLLVKEVAEEANDEDHSFLLPPDNISVKERMAWFKTKLPEFEIFKSTTLTKRFGSRVQEFFGQGCEIRFFMTWISPARAFGQREFVAMESLFKVHRHGCLMILSRTMDSARGYRILKPLLDSGFKVLAVSPDLPFLFNNTPADTWLNDMKGGDKDPGRIPIGQNLSNLIRLVILYKYGGVYLDTDFLVLKDFSGLRNSIGVQSSNAHGNGTMLNNAVLVFDKNHPVLYKFIEEFASTFNGNKWGHNGPYLVSRVIEREAKSSEFNVSILPLKAFYPVNWRKIAGYFVKPSNDGVQSKWVEDKVRELSVESYGVHMAGRRDRRALHLQSDNRPHRSLKRKSKFQVK